MEGKKPKVDHRFLIIHQSFKLAHAAFKYLFWAFVAYCTWQAIDALAGKTTIVNALVAAFLSKDNDYGLPWYVAGAVAAWALLERFLRRKKTEQMQAHIRKLEQRIDPARTSSGLLPSGTHAKDDEL
jgi:hypothetical protein